MGRTPGPWKVDSDGDVVTVARNADGFHRLVAGSYSQYPSEEDAAFIALAPEMLDALKEVAVRIAKREPQDLVSIATLIAKAEPSQASTVRSEGDSNG